MANMKRSDARAAAFKLVAAAGYSAPDPSSLEEIYLDGLEMLECPDDKYIRRIYFGVSENKEKIDEYIEGSSRGWKLARLAKVTLGILRVAAFELIFCEDIPPSVAINEAVELAKQYDDEKAPAFINGILNSIAEACGAKARQSKGRKTGKPKPAAAEKKEKKGEDL
ncbi:MAG TPA: transcription antitermination factor NusB [Clostridiales bacterium]|jgi:N utilization substance protein B|nr:transcription antitermination factor NusB [Clostridiales bacterium]